MTSSPKSRFEFFDRRALVISGDRASIYDWQGGTLGDARHFDLSVLKQKTFERNKAAAATAGDIDISSEPALSELEQYFQADPDVPLYLLADVVEEEFRQDTIPHISGGDRRALIERRVGRLFRGTPYYYTLTQGRETEGRRDDNILLCALTQPEFFNPLLHVLARSKVPLAGVYSLPMLSRLLLTKIGARTPNVLLVSLHSASGLRQTFFKDQQFKFSRQVKLPRLGTAPYGPYVTGEVEKIRRYLNGMRLTSRDAPLSVYILTGGALTAELESSCVDSDQVRYQLIDIGAAAHKIGIAGHVESPYSDLLFVQLLLSQRPKNHYAPRPAMHYYDLHRTRSALQVAALLLLLGSTLWSGFQFFEGITLSQEAEDLSRKADYYNARYLQARERIPQTAVDAYGMKTAVDIADSLMRHKAVPTPILSIISYALEPYPDLQVDKIDWTASVDPKASVSGPSQTATTPSTAAPTPARAVPAPTPPTTAPAAYAYYHIAEVSGHISPFDGDYQRALGRVNGFSGILKTQPSVYEVQVVTEPLDVSSSANLHGSVSTEARPQEAHFNVRVVLGMKGT
ncbi:MAG TPA: hypothetical protein VMH34_08115 [Gammaproteobacteria bacterium]|nr:hypothetical protein [Gammaproteobacteria bacterium]